MSWCFYFSNNYAAWVREYDPVVYFIFCTNIDLKTNILVFVSKQMSNVIFSQPICLVFIVVYVFCYHHTRFDRSMIGDLWENLCPDRQTRYILFYFHHLTPTPFSLGTLQEHHALSSLRLCARVWHKNNGSCGQYDSYLHVLTYNAWRLMQWTMYNTRWTR